jgi:hypothetical protein
VRDLSSVVEKQKLEKESDEKQKAELKVICNSLEEAKAKTYGLLSEMLPVNIADRLILGDIVEPESLKIALFSFQMSLVSRK